MRITTFFAALAAVLPLCAQEPAPAAASLPAAGTPEATQLVDKGIEKMLAVGRGTFRTSEAQDSAMMRGAGMPFADQETDVEGGWHQDLVWGEFDGSHYVRSGGRMLAKVGETWKLRGSKLGSGRPAPFTLDPNLLFTVLRELPAAARQVAHVEAGEVGGKGVAILSLVLENELAAEFVDSGAVPSAGGGMGGGFFMIGGLGGGQLPQPDYTAHLALFVDPANGDVLRVAAKVYEKNPMFGNITVQVAQAGGGGDEEEMEEEEEEEEEAKDAAPVWKKGLLAKKPAKDESVMTFRADFRKLGLAEPPALDDKSKALLRLR